ncbi:MAG: pilus assembly PilX N-terminal domain-containing protein [Candidatus Bathyarchaeota archaeon]|nr:pilus assembly PilX N-terminal domain-containing protein [Candidatus Bathyarchaeota archaeon]
MKILGLKKQKGVTLLFSMIIMTAIIAVAIGLSVLIINQYQFASNLDQVITAYYAAETGIEKHLETIKEGRDNSDLSTTLTTIQADDNVFLSSIPGTKWDTSESTDSEEFLLYTLKMNQRVNFDFQEVGSLEITWSDDCEAGISWLKLAYQAFDNNNQQVGDPEEILFPCEVSGGLCETPTKNFFNNQYNYLISIIPISCNISHLTVKGYKESDKGGGVVKITNRIYLKSIGTSGSSKVAVLSSVPWRLSPQEIFDFVLFSEKTIEK